MTQWKPITEHPGYEVSNEGQVRRTRDGFIKKWNSGGHMTFPTGSASQSTLMSAYWTYEWIKELADDEEAKPFIGQPGYFITTKGRVWNGHRQQWNTPIRKTNTYHCDVSVGGKTVSVSREVGRHFLPDFEEGLDVMHLNECLPVSEVNCLSNLKMGTRSDNIQDARDKGRYPMHTTQEIERDFWQFADKYEKLVWYARSPHKDVIHQVYKNTPEHIIQGALNAQARVQEMYPDEIDAYRNNPDWQHGFNSGCLAAMRYVMTTLYPCLIEDDGESFVYGGLEDAKEEFPMLDT